MVGGGSEAIRLRQFFVEEKPVTGQYSRLDKEDSFHLLRVLRKEEGAEILLAYEGMQFLGKLHTIEGEAFVMVEKQLREKVNRSHLVLCQGVGKSQKTELVLKHATECGIDGFIPIQTDRSVSNLSKKYEGKRKRFEKIAEEAAKQSNRRLIPEIGDLWMVDDLVENLEDEDVLVVCYEDEEERDIMDLSFSGEGTVYLLIGAEGGLAPREIELLEDKGIFVTMGDSILRTETAGIVASYVLRRLMERGRD